MVNIGSYCRFLIKQYTLWFHPLISSSNQHSLKNPGVSVWHWIFLRFRVPEGMQFVDVAMARCPADGTHGAAHGAHGAHGAAGGRWGCCLWC